MTAESSLHISIFFKTRSLVLWISSLILLSSRNLDAFSVNVTSPLAPEPMMTFFVFFVIIFLSSLEHILCEVPNLLFAMLLSLFSIFPFISHRSLEYTLPLICILPKVYFSILTVSYPSNYRVCFYF